MSVRFFGRMIDRPDLLKTMRRFDAEYPDWRDYDDWLSRATYKYAVRHEGRLYPPKLILSMLTGVDRMKFNGGGQTNSVFERLGFEVVDKPGPKAF